MKRMKNICRFYSGNTFAILFLTIILTLCLLYLSLGIGDYVFFVNAQKQYQDAQPALARSIYYTPSTNRNLEEIDIDEEIILSYPAVKDLVHYRVTGWLEQGTQFHDKWI